MLFGCAAFQGVDMVSWSGLTIIVKQAVERVAPGFWCEISTCGA